MKKPSISELLALLDKPALLGWANKIGLEGKTLSQARSENRARGSGMHRQLEGLLAGKDVEIDPTLKKSALDFFAGKEILATEKPIEHDLFVGRLDVKFKREDGSICISDFKTNQSSVYLENRLQLAAYRMAEGCDCVSIISIPSMNEIELNEVHLDSLQEMIFHLAQIYRLKKSVEQNTLAR